jgi:hypothetical protein
MEKFKIKDIDAETLSFNTIGDGSCLLHSLLFCFNKTYRKGDIKTKVKLTRDLRNNLSKVLRETNKKTNKTYYEELSRGEIKELSKELPQLKLNYMEKYLNSNNWLDIFYIELISNQLEVDIYIINNNGEVYNLGDNDIYYKNRKSVILKYIDQAHFEAVGIKFNKIETLFDNNFFIIKKLRDKMNIKKA